MELKPCPFCGLRPDMQFFAGEWYIGCRHPDRVGGTHMVAISSKKSVEDAMRIWNTRWTDDRLEDDLK